MKDTAEVRDLFRVHIHTLLTSSNNKTLLLTHTAPDEVIRKYGLDVVPGNCSSLKIQRGYGFDEGAKLCFRSDSGTPTGRFIGRQTKFIFIRHFIKRRYINSATLFYSEKFRLEEKTRAKEWPVLVGDRTE